MKVFSFVMFWESHDQFVIQTSAFIPNADKWETALLKYYKELGVDEFVADTENMTDTVLWKLGKKYYTTSQIERIMKLRVFL